MDSDAIRSVLNASTFKGTQLTLPVELTRQQYVAVNKAIEAAGGRWSRKDRAHIFSKDARQALAHVLAGNDLTKPRSLKKELQAYFSPPPVVARVMERACIRAGQRVLEPSAGNGALAIAAAMAGGHVKCHDIDPDHVRTLQAVGLDATCADFLAIAPVAAYDRVIMNPPFHGDADMDHVRHALRFLKRHGRLVSVMSPGFKFRQSKKAKAFRELLGITPHLEEDLPENSFKVSGTTVSTVLLTMMP